MDSHSNLSDIPGISIAATPLRAIPPDDTRGCLDAVVEYIDQNLMEDNMEEENFLMLQNPAALKAAEMSFREIIGHTNARTSDGNHQKEWSSFAVQPCVRPWRPTLQMPFSSRIGFWNDLGSASKVHTIETHSENEFFLLFKKGEEEANRFLPHCDNLFSMHHYGRNSKLPLYLKCRKDYALNKAVRKAEKDEEHLPRAGPGRRKNHSNLDDIVEKGRRKKQSAVCEEEEDDHFSELFDRLFLHSVVQPVPLGSTAEDANSALPNNTGTHLQQGMQLWGVNASSVHENVDKTADLSIPLLLCARAMAADDHKNTEKMLKQIRENSSPFGDAPQRLAHYFANCLEARMAGTGAHIFTALTSRIPSASDMLKAYESFLSACPFRTISHHIVNYHVMKLAEKATSLHIVDFGILYGFQWPVIIQQLSAMPLGPPKLRITGIEIPSRGFRPADTVEQARRRIAKYCERFHVPYEFHGIARRWDTIRIEDLKIERREGEAIAVSSLYRFHKLQSEAVDMDESPKTSVLNLIQEINPDVFVHAIINGSYNTPSFFSRFREALFHYSAMVDMLDTVLGRDNPEGFLFERELVELEVLNVIACEGSERFVRPEKYDQWQLRTARAGFRLLPMEKQLMKTLRSKMAGYHKDFVLDEDGKWVRLGWKGRTLCAISYWVPNKKC